MNNLLPHLHLLHFADSAIPIGAVAHSFGLETLISEEALPVDGLHDFLHDYLIEWGMLEVAYCRVGHELASSDTEAFTDQWLELNQRLSAFKPARESRIASATLGRRLLQLALSLQDNPLLYQALGSAKDSLTDTHYATAFGLIGGLLGVDERLTVVAYLQQAITGLLSACQRLMPLGQTQAAKLSWALKPLILEIAEQAAAQDIDSLYCFTPYVEVASMRHPWLETRLFIS